VSSRRLARAGIAQREERKTGMPVELGDRHHELWRDSGAVARLVYDCGLELSAQVSLRGSLERAPWWARFDAVREAWCRANGLMHPQWTQTIDYHGARQAGIDMSSSSRYRLRGLRPM
jgi:aminoglycoside phosphotransferase (APT) family kinase protein